MKYLRLFELVSDYKNIEDEQVSFIEETEDGTYYKAKIIKLTDLKVGDEVGGMRLRVANPSFPKTVSGLSSYYPRFTAAVPGQNTRVEFSSLSNLGFTKVVNGSGSTVSFLMPRPDQYGGPYFTEDTLDFPEGAVVTAISLPVHPNDESWGFDYMVVE
jgi:hypothetical protein